MIRDYHTAEPGVFRDGVGERRRLASKGRLIRLTGWLAAAPAVVGIAVGSWEGYRRFVRMPYFQVAEVHVEGNLQVTADEVVASLGLTPGVSILELDLEALSQRAMQNPWIKEASVRRRLPLALTIHVVERVPEAVFVADRTLFRISYIIGPRNYATVPGFRENAVIFLGFNPRYQFVHENDVAQAFVQAIRTDMPGAFNVVPDDSIRLSDVYEIINAKPMTIPVWLARVVAFFRWRYLGSPTHPSWVQATLVDFSASNAKLKATGWTPHYSCAEAIRTALETIV